MPRFNASDPDNYSGDLPYPEGWEDLLVSYALGDLSPQEEEDFQQLLKNYPELTPEAVAYQANVENLPLPLPEQVLPKTLEAQVLAVAPSTPQLSEALSTEAESLTKARAQPSSRPSTLAKPPSLNKVAPVQTPSVSPETQVRWVSPSRSRRQSRMLARKKTRNTSNQQPWKKAWNPSWAGAGAAAAIAVLLGLNNVQLRGQLSQSARENADFQTRLDTRTAELAQLENSNIRDQAILATLRQPNTLMYELKGTGDALTAFGRLLAVPDHSEVALIAQNLPPLLQSQVYRLWAIATPNGKPMYCGEFPASLESTAVWTVPNNVCSNAPAKMIITVDTAGAPPVPKGPAILQSVLQ